MSSGPSAQTRPPVSDSLISIVVPVYNESGVLVEICQRLRAAMAACRTTFEIIFVNDGSRDGSAELLDRLARQHCDIRVLHLTRNFGHQAALQAGLTHATGDAVVMMDADLQDPPEAIGKLLEAWQAGYDVVYAIRVRRKEWFAKRALFSGFHRLLSSISNTPIPADAGNFGLIDARVARSLLALPEHDRYLPGLRSWVGFKQIGVPIERAARYDDRPRVSCRGLFRLATTAVFSFSSLPLDCLLMARIPGLRHVSCRQRLLGLLPPVHRLGDSRLDIAIGRDEFFCRPQCVGHQHARPICRPHLRSSPQSAAVSRRSHDESHRTIGNRALRATLRRLSSIRIMLNRST